MASALNLRAGTPVPAPTTSSTAFLSFSLNQTTDILSWVFSFPAGVIVTKVGFRYTSRTGTPPTYKISLQAVTNGVPSGTPLGGGTPASATFTPPADTTWNATWQWITLDNAYTTTGGIIALVIAYDSGTVDGSNFSSITDRVTAGASRNLGYPIENNNGSSSRFSTTMVYGLQSASRSYGNPILSLTNTSFSSDSTPDEYALRFLIPTTFCATYQVAGISAQLGAMATGKTMIVTLYDTDGTTPLQTYTWDSDDCRVQSDTSAPLVELYFDESSLATLDAGSAYRIGFAPQETGANAVVFTYDYESNAALSSTPFGSDWYLDTRTNGGVWTDDATVNFRRPGIDLIFAEWTAAPAGGGGGSWGSA